jgi:hypothetical protein
MNEKDDEVMEFNIGTDGSPRIVKLGKGMTPTERKELLALIREFNFLFSLGHMET